MFKKRPRAARPGSPPANLSKSEPAYWQQRLFKNTFTYKGKRLEVTRWSVKLQLFGKRKTFSLNSSDPAAAATEACQIYQSILAQGWPANSRRTVVPDTHAAGKPSEILAEHDLEYWKHRLIHRPHSAKSNSTSEANFSVRIEHGGINQYFSLTAGNEAAAARQAMRIHRTILRHGWSAAGKKFCREFTVALRWLDNPLAWTYSTIHTRNKEEPLLPIDRSSLPTPAIPVAIIEPDPGIRLALAWYVNHQPGFSCQSVATGSTDALREISRRPIQLVLINQNLSNQPGAACLKELHQLQPDLSGVLYSVYEDSEQLFRYTPGGAIGYILKRTAPLKIFDAIAGLTAPLTREQIGVSVREYFQRLFASMTFGPSALEMAKLTPREHDVLALMSKGELAKEIADSLGISIWTVQGHIKNIFEKLRVHTRTEAVVKFLQK